MENPFKTMHWYEIILYFVVIVLAFKGFWETFFGCNSVISYWNG